MKATIAAGILFLAVILSAADTVMSAPHCAASLSLPAGIHLLEAPECLSTEVAQELSGDAEKLGGYLDRFPDTPAAVAYRYWQYLRTERFFPALLTLVELVNGASSGLPATQFRDDMTFLVLSGIRKLPHEVDLFARSGALSPDELSDRFFFILDQVAALYADRKGAARRDSWLLYRSLALLFSGNGGPVAGDPFLRAQYERYHALWKEGVLLPYLAFFAFFTAGDRAFLPPEPLYNEKLAARVILPKEAGSEEAKREERSAAAVVRLMGRFSLENVTHLPALRYVETDDISSWGRARNPAGGGGVGTARAEALCALFDERQAMLAPYKDDLFEPFIRNRALSLMEGCDPRHELPFLVEGKNVYLAERDRWLRDVALIYYLIEQGGYTYREASSLLSGALIAAMARRDAKGALSPFGKALLYAFHTDRLALFRDALFLYRRYGDETSDFTRERTDETIDFVIAFFWGLREEEK